MQTLFIAIRKSAEGHEWLDTDNSSFNYETCKLSLQKAKTLIPQWDKDNPVIRISEFALTEKQVVERIRK